MNTRKLESMIRDAVEDAIDQYEFETNEKVANIGIDINGYIEDGDFSLLVDVYETDE